MKKHLSSLLPVLLLIYLTGCGFHLGAAKEPVEFYYPWANLEAAMKQYPQCTAIGSELREASGHTGDLNYLLSLYLRGPLDEELKSPFPAGCKIVEIRRDGPLLSITLNSAFTQLEDLDLTLSCACLAQTCFGMTTADEVKIGAEAPDDNHAVSVTISRESLLMTDNSAQAQLDATEETH